MKLKNTPYLILSILLTMVACKPKTQQNEIQEGVEMEAETDQMVAVAVLNPKNGSNLRGTVTFAEDDGKVAMVAKIEDVTPGEHAIHIHAIGNCDSPDGSSAGGHWNPEEHDHGKWEHNDFHKGDIGNIVVGSDGKGEIELVTDLWCISCEDEKKNIVGKSIIVHAKADDFTSQPSGAAGSRIGCGVIRLEL